jgi:hypothetical protein
MQHQGEYHKYWTSYMRALGVAKLPGQLKLQGLQYNNLASNVSTGREAQLRDR